MNLPDRLREGSPLRLGELARFLGYSREQLRKWAEAGMLKTVRVPVAGSHRRVSAEEAARFAREIGLLPQESQLVKTEH